MAYLKFKPYHHNSLGYSQGSSYILSIMDHSRFYRGLARLQTSCFYLMGAPFTQCSMLAS
jgi:hypothetical protein